MAHKKGQGSTRNGRDSNPQFRGVKRLSPDRTSAWARTTRSSPWRRERFASSAAAASTWTRRAPS